MYNEYSQNECNIAFRNCGNVKNVKNKSSFITEAIRERIEREEKACLVKELTEGCKVRKSEDRQIALEWDTASGDGID